MGAIVFLKCECLCLLVFIVAVLLFDACRGTALLALRYVSAE